MSQMVMTEVGPLCNCGCGEHLPVGSLRKYKRGHRQAVNQRISRQIDEQLGIEDDNKYNFTLSSPPPRIDAWDTPEYEIDDQGEFTLADAIKMAPDDPESELWDKKNWTAGEIPVKVIKDVEGKLAFMLGSTASLVNIIDPVCGGAFLNNTPNIARNLTPIICQSPGIVDWFGKTSNIMLYINLTMACWPVLAAVWTHHFAKHNLETGPIVDNGQMDINPNMYTVQ